MLRSLALATLVFGLVALHQLDPAGLLAASDPPRLWFGLPLALVYHLAYCFVAAIGLTVALRLAWPAALLAAAGETAVGAASRDGAADGQQTLPARPGSSGASR